MSAPQHYRFVMPSTGTAGKFPGVVYHNSIYNVQAGLRILKLNIDHTMLPDLRLNDHLRLRKQHPCGSYEWTVIRLGADIGLECKGCARRILLTRRELAKRLKANLTEHKDEPSNP